MLRQTACFVVGLDSGTTKNNKRKLHQESVGEEACAKQLKGRSLRMKSLRTRGPPAPPPKKVLRAKSCAYKQPSGNSPLQYTPITMRYPLRVRTCSGTDSSGSKYDKFSMKDVTVPLKHKKVEKGSSGELSDVTEIRPEETAFVLEFKNLCGGTTISAKDPIQELQLLVTSDPEAEEASTSAAIHPVFECDGLYSSSECGAEAVNLQSSESLSSSGCVVGNALESNTRAVAGRHARPNPRNLAHEKNVQKGTSENTKLGKGGLPSVEITPSVSSVEFTKETFVVGKILKHVKKKGRHCFMVSWDGFGPAENSCEPLSELYGCKDMLIDFLEGTEYELTEDSIVKELGMRKRSTMVSKGEHALFVDFWEHSK